MAGTHADVTLVATEHVQLRVDDVRPLVGLALLFGVFYTALAIWGVSVHHPLGLELDLPENIFHWVAGPLSLLLGWLNLSNPGRERPRTAL